MYKLISIVLTVLGLLSLTMQQSVVQQLIDGAKAEISEDDISISDAEALMNYAYEMRIQAETKEDMEYWSNVYNDAFDARADAESQEEVLVEAVDTLDKGINNIKTYPINLPNKTLNGTKSEELKYLSTLRNDNWKADSENGDSELGVRDTLKYIISAQVTENDMNKEALEELRNEASTLLDDLMEAGNLYMSAYDTIVDDYMMVVTNGEFFLDKQRLKNLDEKYEQDQEQVNRYTEDMENLEEELKHATNSAEKQKIEKEIQNDYDSMKDLESSMKQISKAANELNSYLEYVECEARGRCGEEE